MNLSSERLQASDAWEGVTQYHQCLAGTDMVNLFLMTTQAQYTKAGIFEAIVNWLVYFISTM